MLTVLISWNVISLTLYGYEIMATWPNLGWGKYLKTTPLLIFGTLWTVSGDFGLIMAMLAQLHLDKIQLYRVYVYTFLVILLTQLADEQSCSVIYKLDIGLFRTILHIYSMSSSMYTTCKQHEHQQDKINNTHLCTDHLWNKNKTFIVNFVKYVIDKAPFSRIIKIRSCMNAVCRPHG